MADTKQTTEVTQPTDTKPQTTGNPLTDPNVLFYQWLQDNNFAVVIDSINEKTPYLDSRGIVLTDKPLLVVTIKKKEDN